MNLSSTTNQLIESFFRQYFGDEKLKLPLIKIYANRGAKLITAVLGIDGITIGRHVFIRPALIYKNSDNQLCISKNLLVHEITHVIQYQREGFFGFLFNYFGEYFSNLSHKKKWDFASRLQSYLNISHEIEARNIASEFTVWIHLKENYSSSRIWK